MPNAQTSEALAHISYMARERAAAEAAIAAEAAETIAALVATAEKHGRSGEAFDFTHHHIRLLVRSAFLAGINHQFERAALKAVA